MYQIITLHILNYTMSYINYISIHVGGKVIIKVKIFKKKFGMGFRMQQLGPPSTVLPVVRKHVSGGPDRHVLGLPQERRLGDNRPEWPPVMLEPALPASA